MKGPKTLIIITAAAIAWAIASVDYCNEHFLSIPIALKALCVVMCILPAGTSLGMYYPFGVTNLVQRRLDSTVPASYAIATLSSVFGSAYAMTAINNLGFTTVILIGVALYTLVAFVYIAAKALVRIPLQ
jgi:uncharacterized phage infection (PIP) family protein YhgE